MQLNELRKRNFQRFIHALVKPIGISDRLFKKSEKPGKVRNPVLSFLGKEYKEVFLRGIHEVLH